MGAFQQWGRSIESSKQVCHLTHLLCVGGTAHRRWTPADSLGPRPPVRCGTLIDGVINEQRGSLYWRFRRLKARRSGRNSSSHDGFVIGQVIDPRKNVHHERAVVAAEEKA